MKSLKEVTGQTVSVVFFTVLYFKAVTSYRGKHFQVPTRQTGKYKVDLTRHPKFPLAFGELASSRFPHWVSNVNFNNISVISWWSVLLVEEKYHSCQTVKFSVNCVIYPTFY
jgi:hypothetical protein